jgi:zinc protease
MLFFITLKLLFCSSALAKAGQEFRSWKTENGVETYFYENHDVPMVDLRVSFRAGSIYDSKYHGLATLTADMVYAGCGEYSAETLEDHFKSLGAQFSVNASKEFARMQLRTLSTETALKPSLEAFQSCVSQPRFEEEYFVKAKEKQVMQINMRKQSPQYLSWEAGIAKLYLTHPYGKQTLGSQDSVPLITRQQVKQYFKKQYVREGASIVIVGDLTQEQAAKRAESLSKFMQHGTKPKLRDILKHPILPQNVHRHFDGKQTTVLLLRPGKQLTDKDYWPVQMASHIIGGGDGLTSLLAEKIRGEHGLVYAVFSGMFSYVDGPGAFYIQFQTKNDQANDAYEMVVGVLEAMNVAKISSKRLAESKRQMLNPFFVQKASNAGMLTILQTIADYQLPLDYYLHWEKQISNLSRKEVFEAWSGFIQKNKFITIATGPQGLV